MIKQFGRFIVVGGLGFVIDAGGVWLLTYWGWSPFTARVPSIAAAMFLTWLLNRTMTFRVETPGTRREVARYVMIATTSAFLNFVIYSAFVLVGVLPVLAVVFATGILMVGSFFAYRHLVFN